MGLLPFIMACSNTEEIQDKTTNPQKEIFSLEIAYDGKCYNVPCSLDEEGNIEYLDTEFKELYDSEISQIPNLITLSNGDNKVTYFHSTEDMFKELNYTIVSSNIMPNESRALADTFKGKVTLWDDTGFKDRSISFEIGYHNIKEWPHLKYPFQFNDKTSALKVYSLIPYNNYVIINNGIYSTNNLQVVFLGYEDDHYNGKVLTCIPPNSLDGITPGEFSYDRLKNIGWNDKITSIRLEIVYKGLLTNNNEAK